jgi:membrane associated rhomboid family serine protease
MRDLPPRRRASAPAWTRPITERLTPAVKALVLIQTVLYFFYVLVREIRPLFEAHLAVGPGMLHGELWQPLTAMFVNFNLLGFVFNLVGLWFVGAFIERTNGTRRFLQLFFTAGIAAFVVMGLVARLKPYGLGEGCSYAVLALFVAFGRMYDRSPAQILGGFVMQARHLAMLLVGFQVMVDLARGDWASLAATLVASAIGFGLSGGSFGDLLALMRARRLRRRYRVLDGGQSGPVGGGIGGGIGNKTGTKPGTRTGTKTSRKKDQYWN